MKKKIAGMIVIAVLFLIFPSVSANVCRDSTIAPRNNLCGLSFIDAITVVNSTTNITDFSERIGVSNKINQSLFIDYEVFVCRCQNHLGSPNGRCLGYWPFKSYIGYGDYLENCNGLGRTNLTISPLQNITINFSLTQYRNELCGMFQYDLHIYSINQNNSCTGAFGAKVVDLCVDCKNIICGDGIVEAGEECDDGNTIDGDGCNQFCTIEKTCLYECFIPDNLNDTKAETILYHGGAEKSLQQILSDAGYNLNATTHQTNIQVWNATEDATIEIKVLDIMAGSNKTFGYYLGGNENSFVPLFEIKDNPDYNLPVLNAGDSIIVNLSGEKIYGFAIDSKKVSSIKHYTENNLNGDKNDHAIVYNLCNEFIIGFENGGGDWDYQDLVVSVKILDCGDKLCPRNESFGLETPGIWIRNNTRIVLDDNTEPGRYNSSRLIERINNYAFEGEKIAYQVLVIDSNGVENIGDVYLTIGNRIDGDIEANCLDSGEIPKNIRDFNVRINEQDKFCFNDQIMKIYNCTFTVETPESMYGEYFIKVIAEDDDGNIGEADENEFWFLNPVVAISVDGELSFEDVRAGTQFYSDTILVGNDADSGSGVMLDMFVSGTDFYDSSSSGAKCPFTNQLALSNFRYFATNGAYSTQNDMENDFVDNDRDVDAEGYVNIDYGIGFNDPQKFYENAEIIQDQKVGPYYVANILAPGAEMALTFKLALPEPCNGDFDSGQIFFWGEAI